jgi:SAM-dependent methyltransferase
VADVRSDGLAASLLMRHDLLTMLRCVACGSTLAPIGGGDVVSALSCSSCGRRTPIVDGIPRFVTVPEDLTARRTQNSFGYEWSHFNDWRQSGETNFNDYFQGAPWGSLRTGVVLDAGCGMGRHARHVAAYAGRVVAVDFSRAIDQAARNVADLGNVDCVQADLLELPFADESFDYAYSLGVLHHLSETERALRTLIRKVRPGGRLRVYLYWKRHGWQGRVLAVVTTARRVTTKMPFALLRFACFALSAVLYVAVVLPYRVLSALGLSWHQDWPLFVYSKYPFQVLYNDQFDRFSAPIEKRYDSHEVKRLLEDAGLQDVEVRPCFGWVAEGTRPSR